MLLFLALLLNAILIVRPGECIPGLQATPFYEVTLAAYLLLGFSVLLFEFSAAGRSTAPLTTLILAFSTVVVVSNAGRLRLDGAISGSVDYFRIAIYYLILVGSIRTIQHIRLLLFTTTLCTVLVTSLAVLNFRGIVAIPAYAIVDEFGIRRMAASGLFGDPNELAALINQGLIICFGFGLVRQRGTPLHKRLSWLAASGLLLHGLTLTASRGGLLSLMASILVYLFARVGRRAILAAGLVLPLLIAAAGGRQLDFGGAMGSGTGRTRVELWDAYLGHFRANLLLGIGYGNSLNLESHVAHNSFISVFAEMGVTGGILFIGFFWLAFVLLRACHRGIQQHAQYGPEAGMAPESVRHARELSGLYPIVLALCVNYAIGLSSLSRQSALPTYFLLALVTIYYRACLGVFMMDRVVIDSRIWTMMLCLSVTFLVVMSVYISRTL
jgi:O-antigen ligase